MQNRLSSLSYGNGRESSAADEPAQALVSSHREALDVECESDGVRHCPLKRSFAVCQCDCRGSL
jgi:hypothetical protein